MGTWNVDFRIDTTDLEIETDKESVDIIMHYNYSPADPEVGIMHGGMDFTGWDFKNPSDKTEDLEDAIEKLIYERNLDVECAEEADDDRDDYFNFIKFGCI